MDYYSEVLTRYRSKGLLLDTGLLLLFMVGAVDRARIERFKRTRAFTGQDYDLLRRMLGFFANVVTTPNILTEVGDLLGQLPEEILPECYAIFSRALRKMDEKYVPSQELAAQGHFIKFGLTDSSIVDTCRGKYLVLTVDLPLFHYLTNAGIDAINFNHLRSFGWFSGSLS